ncbi:MAG: sigma-54 interaction domain-containing protein [Parvibaculaceae bacterium]
MHTNTPLAGALVVDAAGKIVFASGVGTDPRLQNLATDRLWMREAREHRLRSVSLDRRQFVALLCGLPNAELLAIMEPGAESVFAFVGSVDFAYDIINHLLSDPFDAMTVVDADARVAYLSPVHQRFFDLGPGDAVGRPVRDVIENTGLERVIRTGKAEIGELQRMKGAERVVSRVPIQREGRVIGAVGRVMFKGPEQVEALSRRVRALEREVEFYRGQAAALRSRFYGLDAIIGESPAMRRLRTEIVKVAPLEIAVLIRGESGTGKELVAHALHRLSPRRDATLVAVNAAALPVSLVEAELFGYEPGAFTGADRKGRKGKFEQAANGTLFLDEIGDMPLEVQVKLLRVLQDRMVERIGGGKPREVDFRLITATHTDLQAQVEHGKFRLDLYYRISPVVIEVPPLRERIEDIPLLVAHFMDEVAQRHGRPPRRIAPVALDWLMDQLWPGNVRQLCHEIERAFVFADGDTIEVHDFQHGCSDNGEGAVAAGRRIGVTGATLQASIGQVEFQMIRAAMEKHRGNKKRVAEELGISRSYLYKKLAESA